MSYRNNNGSNACGVDGAMSEFDKLPKALRVALANADHNWSGEQLHRVRRKRSHPHNYKVRTIPLALAFLKEQDARKHNADADAGLILGGQR
jgi:hypothetical protein